MKHQLSINAQQGEKNSNMRIYTKPGSLCSWFALMVFAMMVIVGCGKQSANDTDADSLSAIDRHYAELTKKAEAGDEDAMLELGRKYYNSIALVGDYGPAIKLFEQLLERNNPYGKFWMGVCYENPYCMMQDTVKADSLLKQAFQELKTMAEQGDAQAQLYVGRMYNKGLGVDTIQEEAVKWWRKSAELGNAEAQYTIGGCYENGFCMAQSDEEAAKWYHKAAEQGNVNAQISLALCYHNGKGVAKSYEEAAKWYRKAAEQGDASAQYVLGLCYEDGMGVAQSHEEAVKWWRKAADQGHKTAKDALERLNQ